MSKASRAIALRELRAGLSGFRVFLACLFLGVAAIAGVGSLADAIRFGLEREGQAILGGDIEIRAFQTEATPEQIETFEQLGTVSYVTRMRAIARSENTGERTLVELKAVDNLYPLYGNLELQPQIATDQLLQQRGDIFGVAIPPNLADRLRVSVGDTLLIGEAEFEIRSILEKEPDQANEGFQLGPTALVSLDSLPTTGLVQVGSLIYYRYRIALPEGSDIEAIRESLNEQYPEARWQIRDRGNSAPGLRRFVDRMGMFLTLVGLSALVVGGVGVGNAVRAYMDRKIPTIATLKILGATGGTVFHIYLTQILLIALVAIVTGLIAGAFLPPLLAGLLTEALPVSPTFDFYPGPLVVAAAYGTLITIAFAVWPLAKARDIPSARLFRQIVNPSAHRPRLSAILTVLVAASMVVGLAIGLSQLKLLATGFVAGSAIALILLRFIGWGVERMAAKSPRFKNPGLRMAVANLHRPGAATGAVVLSLGLGLTLFATITLIESNLSDEVSGQIPDQAPAFFMIDIRKTDEQPFQAMIDNLPGVEEFRLVPSIRGRITEVNGISSDEIEADPDHAWVLRGDRGLTFSASVPENNTVVEGEWWPEDYTGPPLISMAAEEARGLGINIGDTLAFRILGRDIEARVASLRDLNWASRGFNFVVVFDPNTLRPAPYTFMASLKIEEEHEALAHRTITDQFPSVTTIRMKEILSTLDGMLDQIGTAIRATAMVAILAGILVLAGALAAGHRHRVYDAVVLKVLGAQRRDVLRAFVLEYAVLGLITGVLALLLGSIAGYAVVEWAMELDFRLNPIPMIVTVLSAVILTVVFGLIGTWSALGARPARILRTA